MIITKSEYSSQKMAVNNFIFNKPQTNILIGKNKHIQTEGSSLSLEPLSQVNVQNVINRKLNPIYHKERKHLQRGSSKENNISQGQNSQIFFNRPQSTLTRKKGSVIFKQSNLKMESNDCAINSELQKKRKESCFKRLQQKFKYLMQLNSERYKMHRKTGNIQGWIKTKHSVKMSSSLITVMQNLQKIERAIQKEKRESKLKKIQQFRAINFEPIKSDWNQIQQKKRSLINFQLEKKKIAVQRQLPQIQNQLNGIVEQQHKQKKLDIICEKDLFQNDIIEDSSILQNRIEHLSNNNENLSIEITFRDRQLLRVVKTEQQQRLTYNQINSQFAFNQKQESHSNIQQTFKFYKPSKSSFQLSREKSLIQQQMVSIFFKQKSKKKEKEKDNNKVTVYKKNRMNLLGQMPKTTGITRNSNQRVKLKGYEGIRRKKIQKSDKYPFVEMNKELIRLRENYGVVMREL